MNSFALFQHADDVMVPWIRFWSLLSNSFSGKGLVIGLHRKTRFELIERNLKINVELKQNSDDETKLKKHYNYDLPKYYLQLKIYFS